MPDRLVAHFRAMARNNAWANDRLLEACARLDPADFAALGFEDGGFSDG